MNDTGFITTSDDGTLRLWDAGSRKQENILRFDIDAKQISDPKTKEILDSSKPRSVAISLDEKSIAVGFKDGTLRIVDAIAWTVIYEDKCSKAWVSDLKFSPDGKYLAIGSHDTIIQVFEFPTMTRKVTFKGHSSCISHLDWSENSQILHSNSGDYELLFWDIGSGKQVTSGATNFRNENWATWTCVIGWPVQGIWPTYSKGTDINACDRSVYSNDNYKLLATSDDFGKLNIYRYPCIDKGAKAIEGRGHSSHVTNVRFGLKKKYIFTTGGNDGCVLQWNIN